MHVGDWLRDESAGGPLRILVMDLLGDSLEKKLQGRKEKKFSLGKTIQAGIQIFELIKVTHEHNLLHRDIKPANFLYGTGY